MINFLLKNWKFIGLCVLLIVIAVEHHRVMTRDIVITKLTNTVQDLREAIQTQEDSINAYEVAVDDSVAKLIAADKQLKLCHEHAKQQAEDLATIDTIMNAADDTAEPPVQETAKENSNDTISNTTQSKGIDFINSQFDAIK